MLKRLIEHWLSSISEREFDIPFRLLLEALAHIAIGHATKHGAMELGKDIVSWHSEDGLFYFFQLKAGDITLSTKRYAATTSPTSDGSLCASQLQVGDPYQPIWVCTGQLQETVRLNIGLMNQDFRQNGRPQVWVWERNDLIELYHDVFYGSFLQMNS